ncbi:SMI1/KNR4 family protein [Clostridium estertheticum]|uniref:SMI1/KNR4 family protein n=1 Tax=Clostridium estertheticum TaxID=238834 RepID=A0AA47EKZ6_9CLOT|nr:SMI1/KNR4 family protein [Clostridium estertheticum]MBU3154424.1 SMI1/KNR4 family protein [Clostridium estertheticum]MBW9152697.1 SMI1/KNR4 family protein [Clostridium estertheticum]WAG62132.1 SMI1/KNR4 family protein [Clostridium estertheticum]WLC82507.1 SMI1/KNR4 family protein [Clostridium estertheticum]
MNILPKGLRNVLSNDIYLREDKKAVFTALKELGIKPSNEFIEFYTSYSGPFWEETLGVELMDIIEENNNIFTYTNICREQYGFDNKYVILTEMSVNEVIVLDSETDKLYRVNFEGGDELLKKGKLNEEWNSFNNFLKEYFDC